MAKHIQLNQEAQELAKTAAATFTNISGVSKGDIKTAILFTSGIDKFVEWDETQAPVFFGDLPGFEDLKLLGQVEGHSRCYQVGTYKGVQFLTLHGRIHLNEDPTRPGIVNKLCRLQFDLLFELGIETLILTSAVGSCSPGIVRPGQINLVTGYRMGSAQAITGRAGEFTSLSDALENHIYCKVRDFASTELPFGHFIETQSAFWHGPHVEDIPTKMRFAKEGAHTVGMSGPPAVEAAARYGMSAIPFGLVTNGFIHDHTKVLRVVQEHGPVWVKFIMKVALGITQYQEMLCQEMGKDS